MEKFAISLVFVNFLFLICNLRVSCQEVTTKSGKIIGFERRSNVTGTEENITVSVYLGIPFAKPPVGDLRFQKPVPIEPWTEPVQNTFPKPNCIQWASVSMDLAKGHSCRDSYKDEDCLYMNIWVPPNTSEQDKKSVLFWIPGGDFFSRTMFPNVSALDGDAMAYFGDVIVVTTNYRFGLLGFFYVPERPDAPGNVGIWDVIVALKWVNENIEAFGGDKDSITVGGQDGGAVILTMLAVTPQAKGLFKRQIVQSGSIMSAIQDEDRAFKESEEMAIKLKCATLVDNLNRKPQKALDCLRGKDSKVKVNAWSLFSYKYANDVWPYDILPRWGDDLFPDDPRTALLKGDLHFTDLLIGNSGNEGVYLTTHPGKVVERGDLTREDAIIYIRKALQLVKLDDEDKIRLDKAITKNYFKKNVPAVDVNYAIQKHRAMGDFIFICPTMYYATVANKSGVNVYYYDFQYRKRNSTFQRTTHFDEMYYVFGDPIVPYAFRGKYSPEERRLSKRIIHHWSNFIKYGQPAQHYPSYGLTLDKYVYITDRQQVRTFAPKKHNCRLWWNVIYPKQKQILPTYF